MFFKIFNNLRYKPVTAFIIYTLITCFLITCSLLSSFHILYNKDVRQLTQESL